MPESPLLFSIGFSIDSFIRIFWALWEDPVKCGVWVQGADPVAKGFRAWRSSEG